MIDEKVLTEIRAQHPNVVHLKKDDDEAVFRLPSRAEYRHFKQLREDDATKVQSIEELIVLCRVYPEQAEFAAMLDRRCGLIDAFGGGLLVAMGVGEAKAVKK